VVRYTALAFAACTDCHRDPHRGAMKQVCTDCHTTADWNRLLNRSSFERTFNHTTTKFALNGAHARADCRACHAVGVSRRPDLVLKVPAAERSALYPRPEARECVSCHTDYHRDVFARSPVGPRCTSCHTEAAWTPTTFDLTRHNEVTWRLTGGHLAVPCAGCHRATGGARGPPQFRLASRECVACHVMDDPHAGQFGARACDPCHGTGTFRVTAFDHARTRYPLDGRHRGVSCAGCHATVTPPGGKPVIRYRPLEFATCRACHAQPMEGTP
jgi:hypothetical protein